MDRRTFLEASTLLAGSALLKQIRTNGSEFAAASMIGVADQPLIGIQSRPCCL